MNEFQDHEQRKGCDCGKAGCLCHACKMPIKKEEDFGTEEDGSKNCEYCIHCYQNGILKNERENTGGGGW